jgi:hypothetical protein
MKGLNANRKIYILKTEIPEFGYSEIENIGLKIVNFQISIPLIKNLGWDEKHFALPFFPRQ